MKTWSHDEMLTLDLGDARLNHRCGAILEALADAPEASFPQAMPSPAATKALYRFLANEHVDAAALQAAHLHSTLQRCQAHPHLLAIQDTSLLDFTSHPQTEDLGYLTTDRGRGFFVHSVLLSSPEGVPLGLAYQESWARPLEEYGKKALRKQKPIEDKESYKWLKALFALSETLPDTAEVTVVSDQESDLFEYFCCPRPAHLHLLFRSTGVRSVSDGRLKHVLQQQSPAGEVSLSLQRKDNQAARTARLAVRYAPVQLKPPARHARAQELEPVQVWAVLAEEVSEPPAGSSRISWLLVSTRPVRSGDDACTCLELYSRRWLIERYHYVLKSGCQFEALQLSSRERLERALALYCMVAWRLLWMTYLARTEPETSCERVFEPHEWQALHGYMEPQKALPQQAPTLHQAIRWVAQLGGFLNRKGDGEPGVKVLWKGWAKLMTITETWLRFQQNTHLLRPPDTCG